METTNSIRMYLTEMGKVPLLTREQELRSRAISRKTKKTLKMIVLELPITLRELRNWESLLDQQEMTPKELMPRGRKTNQDLSRMRSQDEKRGEVHLPHGRQNRSRGRAAQGQARQPRGSSDAPSQNSKRAHADHRPHQRFGFEPRKD